MSIRVYRHRGIKKIVLSWGLGVESTAILYRWFMDPESRDFDLEWDLIVLTCQVGSEHPDTKLLCEKFILPLMRAHRVRYVQVARAGHLESDGIIILSDTRQPRKLYINGAYTLADELRAAGTVPQFAGDRHCSQKFKAWVAESWLERELAGQSYRHAFGYNYNEESRITKSEKAFAEREPEPVLMTFGFNYDEESRIAKAAKYDTPRRKGYYPLYEWEWSREKCLQYLKDHTGVIWPRSCCGFCPFRKPTEETIKRMRRYPRLVTEALLLEHQSLSLNPRGSLYRDRTILSLATETRQTRALRDFNKQLESAEYALYRVRRLYKGPGKANRAVQKLKTGSRTEMEACFEELAPHLNVRIEHGIRYGYARERVFGQYPALEELFVVAPAVVESKTRYGFEWFEPRWKAAIGEARQKGLFD